MAASSFMTGDEVRLIHIAFEDGATIGQVSKVIERGQRRDALIQILLPTDALNYSLIHEAVVLQACDDSVVHCLAVQQSFRHFVESDSDDEGEKLVALTLLVPKSTTLKNKLNMQRAQGDASDRSSSEESDIKPRIDKGVPQTVRLAMPPLDASQRYWLETNIRPRLSDEQHKLLEDMSEKEQMIILYHFFQAQERALSDRYRQHQARNVARLFRHTSVKAPVRIAPRHA